MLALQFSVLAAMAALSSAAPAPAQLRHVAHEERKTTASDWVKGARIEADALLPMRIGLTQTNLDHGEDFLRQM
jgi:tripeptidyl-peptidase-1